MSQILRIKETSTFKENKDFIYLRVLDQIKEEREFRKLVKFSEKDVKRKQINERLSKNSLYVNDKNNKILSDKLFTGNNTTFVEITHSSNNDLNLKNEEILTKPYNNNFIKSFMEENEKLMRSNYFDNIIKKCKDKTNNVSIKSLEPLKKLFNNKKVNKAYSSILITSNILEFSPMNLSKIKRQMTKIVPNNKKSSNKINLNILPEIINDDMINNPTKSEVNKKIVENNNNIKIVCYKSSLEKDLSVEDILTTDLLKNYELMAHVNSKYSLIKQEESYHRLKRLEEKLPYILNPNKKKE